MEEAPFGEEHQLCHELKIADARIVHQPLGASPNNTSEPAKAYQAYLPGEPRLKLADTDIGKHLRAEYITQDLDRLAPYLWIMTTQSSANIAPLTEQLVRGRKIVISENPGLHLVWYLLSHAFWKHYLLSKTSPIPDPNRIEILQAARGFVRSYAYLIRHRSDFALAVREEASLLPKSISFADFIQFVGQCQRIDDELVSRRYRFGELRLMRLNFWITVFLFKPHYHQVEWQYGAYFAQYYAPILFIFAALSLLLSSMQVVLAVQTILGDSDSWLIFASVSRGFSVFTIFFVALVAVTFLVVLIILIFREFIYAAQDRFRPNHRRPSSRAGGYGAAVGDFAA
ncbi:hypothetical protein GGR52DRAFT_591445 [Hypoxylon sp. FL1284]|nr:hypothetical protein GGR52DRAFT_591445 [Hypoxylon sp. FL1284]